MDSYGIACFSRFFRSIFQGNGNAGHLSNFRFHGDQAGMASPWTPCAISRSGVSKQWPVGQTRPPCVFINKTVLTHSYLIHLCTVYSCFHATTAELYSCNRDRMYEYVLQSLTSLLSGPLQKSWLTLFLIDGYQVWFGAKCPLAHGKAGKTRTEDEFFKKFNLFNIKHTLHLDYIFPFFSVKMYEIMMK